MITGITAEEIADVRAMINAIGLDPAASRPPILGSLKSVVVQERDHAGRRRPGDRSEVIGDDTAAEYCTSWGNYLIKRLGELREC